MLVIAPMEIARNYINRLHAHQSQHQKIIAALDALHLKIHGLVATTILSAPLSLLDLMSFLATFLITLDTLIRSLSSAALMPSIPATIGET